MTHPRIFVQIASYRDSECQWTIKDLFERARHPERVFVGVCWQFVADEDADCFVVSTRPEQVRTVEFDAAESEGVGWARNHAQKLWRGEEYVLQIDSHMRFVDDWDEKMIDMLARCPSEHPILTNYPPGYEPPDTRLDTPLKQIRFIEFADTGIGQFATGGEEEVAAAEGPLPCAFCAAGFLFAKGDIIEHVPYDPYILFFGEEISLAARLWTHGWDFFTPNEVLLYHFYGERDAERRRDIRSPSEFHLTWRTTLRLEYLFGMRGAEDPDALVDIEKYGLGTKRSLREYEEFSGLNFRARTIAQYARTWPYHLSEELKRERDNVRQRATFAETAQAFVVGDGGIVYSEPTREIHHLNRGAMFVWACLEEGESQDTIVSTLCNSLGVPEHEADALLKEILQHWWDSGLLESSPPGEIIDVAHWNAVRESFFPMPVGSTPRQPAHRGTIRRIYSLAGTTVEIEFDTSKQEAQVRPILAHLESSEPSATADARISIVADGRSQIIYLDDELESSYSDIAMLGPAVRNLILRVVMNDPSSFMCLRSGVVSDGETCLLLPSESGHTRSALTAAFVKSGYTFCSDEVALLSNDTFEITPVPLAMGVRERDFKDIAKLYRRIPKRPKHEHLNGTAIRYFLPPDGRYDNAAHRSMRVRRIVFPTYDAAQPTKFDGLDLADALQLMLGECLALPIAPDRQGIAAFVQWFRQMECYRLNVSSLDEAVMIGERLLAEGRA